VPGAVLLLCRRIAACSQASRRRRICALRRARANGTRTACSLLPSAGTPWNRGNQYPVASHRRWQSAVRLMSNPRSLALDEATERLPPRARRDPAHHPRGARQCYRGCHGGQDGVSRPLGCRSRDGCWRRMEWSTAEPHLLREGAELMHRHLGYDASGRREPTRTLLLSICKATAGFNRPARRSAEHWLAAAGSSPVRPEWECRTRPRQR